MTTWEEFKKGLPHNVDYGKIGTRILESKDNEEIFRWIEAQGFSEFEKGIVIGLMTAWIEIFVKNKDGLLC